MVKFKSKRASWMRGRTGRAQMSVFCMNRMWNNVRMNIKRLLWVTASHEDDISGQIMTEGSSYLSRVIICCMVGNNAAPYRRRISSSFLILAWDVWDLVSNPSLRQAWSQTDAMISLDHEGPEGPFSMGTEIHKRGSWGRKYFSPTGLCRDWLSLLALWKKQEVIKYTKLGKEMGGELWKAETRQL